MGNSKIRQKLSRETLSETLITDKFPYVIM